MCIRTDQTFNKHEHNPAPIQHTSDVQKKHILETNTHTHNAASIARDTYLRTLKAVLDYTVSRIKLGNKQTAVSTKQQT